MLARNLCLRPQKLCPPRNKLYFEGDAFAVNYLCERFDVAITHADVAGARGVSA